MAGLRIPKSYSRITRVLLGLILWGTANPVLLACGVSPHSILQVQGKVKVQRGGSSWDAYSGLGLNNNHRLALSSGAKVTIYCSNTQIKEVSARGGYPVSGICSSARSNNNNRCSIYRNEEDPNTPYLISPRNTKITESQPLLSWHPVEGATSYRVEFVGTDWSTKVKGTLVRYDGEEVLQTDWYYEVKITAYQGENDIAVSSAGFTILSEEEYQQLEVAAKELEEQFSERQVLAIALVNLYRDYELYADAIEVLQYLLSEGQPGAGVYQILGQTYRDVDLLGLAKEQFVKALEAAEAEDNLELQGNLQASLGEVTDLLATTQTDFQEAADWLQGALVAYQGLEELTVEEAARIAEIEDKLVEVKGKIE
ncbi:MAG: TraB/GumN family protein [Symploca sp. SIO2E6]|nr:TraB/GumN family protein [Symploca sp. SIO2E6]